MVYSPFLIVSPLFTIFLKLFFFYEPKTILKSKKQSYRALLDSSKMMEEKQAGQFPKSKGPKKLHERDHFAKVWAVILHCLGTHFTKTLSNTDKDSLSSEHNDQNLQGGGGASAKSLRRFT